jgi:hypothetical protein
MPNVYVKHRSDVEQYFREKGFNMKNSLPGLMRQAGRLCAVSLAFQTQPFGNDEKAEALGKVATYSQIYRVYATPGKAFDDIQNPKAQAGFWKAVKASAWDRAKKILNRSGSALKTTAIDNFDGGAAHRQLRNNRGRIPTSQKPVMIVRNPSALKTYVASETDKVGQGKGGWATCARILGGVRGIPRWVTKHNSPGQVIENYGTDRTTITLINQVPYASEILSASQKAEAVNIASDRLFKSIQIAQRNRGRAILLNA